MDHRGRLGEGGREGGREGAMTFLISSHIFAPEPWYVRFEKSTTDPSSTGTPTAAAPIDGTAFSRSNRERMLPSEPRAPG